MWTLLRLSFNLPPSPSHILFFIPLWELPFWQYFHSMLCLYSFIPFRFFLLQIYIFSPVHHICKFIFLSNPVVYFIFSLFLSLFFLYSIGGTNSHHSLSLSFKHTHFFLLFSLEQLANMDSVAGFEHARTLKTVTTTNKLTLPSNSCDKNQLRLRQRFMFFYICGLLDRSTTSWSASNECETVFECMLCLVTDKSNEGRKKRKKKHRRSNVIQKLKW